MKISCAGTLNPKARTKKAVTKLRLYWLKLGKQIGVGQSKVSKIFDGSSPISLAQGMKAAAFLNVDPNWLLGVDMIRESLSIEEAREIKKKPGRDFFIQIVRYSFGLHYPPGEDSSMSDQEDIVFSKNIMAYRI